MSRRIKARSNNWQLAESPFKITVNIKVQLYGVDLNENGPSFPRLFVSKKSRMNYLFLANSLRFWQEVLSE